MGAWGYGNFDNDMAADYAASFHDEHNEAGLLETLAAVAEEGYPEADEASEALAAAEIIAATLGKASRDFPENLLPIASTLPLTNADAAKKIARRAIKAVLKKSELQELWEESDEYEAWQTVQQQLLDRLV